MMATNFKDDFAARSSAGPTPVRCMGPKGRSTGPFGNDGPRRCPNTATRWVTPVSAAGHRLSRLALCVDHTPLGHLGMTTPTNWTWKWEAR